MLMYWSFRKFSVSARLSYIQWHFCLQHLIGHLFFCQSYVFLLVHLFFCQSYVFLLIQLALCCSFFIKGNLSHFILCLLPLIWHHSYIHLSFWVCAIQTCILLLAHWPWLKLPVCVVVFAQLFRCEFRVSAHVGLF